MSPRLKIAIDAVRKAGDSTLEPFRNRVGYELKSDASPVTTADRNAETILREELGLAFPGEAILGEEEGQIGAGASRWVLDPIDGTKSFIAGVPLYATLLAWEEDGLPTIGVCYFPALGEMLWAEAGTGAFLNGERIRVSTRSSASGSILACGGPSSMLKYGRWEGFANLTKNALATRTWSDAYGHSLVARGSIDAMIDPVVSRWDLSAVRVIVKEAGGQFTDFRGSDPFAKGDFELEAISSNGLIHSEVLEAFV